MNNYKREQVKKGTQKDFERMFRNAKQPLTKILHPYNQKEEKQDKTTNEIFIELYLRFKDKCLKFGINDTDEIIKLFEVWTRTCS